MNNTEISETLCISVGTTKAHIHNIFAKVDIKRRRDLMQIYEKYKENLKTEESVIEQFTKADTKENWVANLKKKYRSMRQLYIENEALLNLYIRPFTEGRMELNDELADEFLKQIRDASAQG